MARVCAIATILFAASCKSNHAVVSDKAVEVMRRTVDTVAVIPGASAQLIADIALQDGKLVMGDVAMRGDGISMGARIEDRGGRAVIVVDADIEARSIAVQLQEEVVREREHIDEEQSQDSRVFPVSIAVVAVLAIVLIIYFISRWIKK